MRPCWGRCVGALSDDELHDAVIGLRKLCTSSLAAAEARLLSEWDARRSWAEDGSRSAAARLARDTGSDPRSCRRDLWRARCLRTMPLTSDALAAGRIGPDNADSLWRAN